MNMVADTHTHSVACGHAYSTIGENIEAAGKQGLTFLACTEHGVAMSDAPPLSYFLNLRSIPDQVNGIWVLKGCEANILDFNGKLDLTDEMLDSLDWVIASFHTVVLAPGSQEQHTNALLQLARNPLVDVIGHPGDERYRFDYERVIPVLGEYGKIVEINAHSPEVRPGSRENCEQIALLCKKYRVRVVVNSDAHFSTQIGRFDFPLDLLKRIDFPEELIVNADKQRFAALVREKSHLRLPEVL